MPKYCLHCGLENSDDAKVCPFCEYTVLDELKATFPFIQENLFLVATISTSGGASYYRQYLEFRKISPISQEIEFSDKLECIHTVIAAIPYDKFQAMNEAVSGSKEELSRAILGNIKSPIQPDIGAQADTELKLLLEDAWFAFKSWVQGISEAGLDALKLQANLENNFNNGMERAIPIANFLFKCLIQVSPEFILEFLARIERECRFEGKHHRSSLRANLDLVMQILYGFYWQNELYWNEEGDKRFYRDFGDTIRAIAELDAEFLFERITMIEKGNNKIDYDNSSNPKSRISRKPPLHFLLSKEEYAGYPQFRRLLIDCNCAEEDCNSEGADEIIQSIRHNIAQNPEAVKFPEYRALFNDKNMWVRTGVALNPEAVKFPEYRALFNDESTLVRRGVARNPNAAQFPEYRHLFNDKNFWVRRDVVRNKNAARFPEFKNLFPTEWIADLNEFLNDILTPILAHPEAITYPEYELLFLEEDGYFREILAKTADAAKFPQFRALISSILSGGTDSEKKALLLNPEAVVLPEYNPLFTDEDFTVRMKVAEKPKAVNIPEYKQFFTDEHPAVRASAARNPQAPSLPEYRLLFADENPVVRKFVAANPEAVKYSEYVKFFSDPDLTVRQSAAENPQAPSLPEYRRFFTDDAWFIRRAVSKNPNAAHLEGFEQFLAKLQPHIRPDRDEEEAKAIAQLLESENIIMAEHNKNSRKIDKPFIFLKERLAFDTIKPESLNKPLLEPDHSIIIEIETLIGGVLPLRSSHERRYERCILNGWIEEPNKWDQDLIRLDFGVMSENGRVVGLGLNGDVLKYDYSGIDNESCIDNDYLYECFSGKEGNFAKFEKKFQDITYGSWERIHYRGKNLSDDPEVLEQIVEKIKQLSHIRSLNLMNNNLSTLPDSFGRLSSMDFLNLSGNAFTALPEWILTLSDLRVLNVNNNQISSVPESIDRLSKLIHLNLNKNQLTSLPKSILKLPQLSQLEANENPKNFTEFVDEWRSLRMAALGRNK